jgi:hypothetical protein
MSSSSSGDEDSVRYTGALHGRNSQPASAASPASTHGKASSSKKGGRKGDAGQPGYVDVYGKVGATLQQEQPCCLSPSTMLPVLEGWV